MKTDAQVVQRQLEDERLTSKSNREETVRHLRRVQELEGEKAKLLDDISSNTAVKPWNARFMTTTSECELSPPFTVR